MNEPTNCPTCGATIPADALEGVCPACALGRGLGVERMTEDEAAFRRAEMETLATAFPEFELIELIGRGGMGEVYQARQKKLNRLVAIKILPEPFGKSDEYTERFHREAQSLARLNHPNIVTIYDYGEANGLCYFVMEFVDGVDLRRMIEAKTLTAEEALRIVPQVCDALQFAHDQGIVHRDIKPANILLDKQGRVKIADFGLAKIVGKTANDLTLTATGDVMGTAEYMAPEQRRASQSVDHRADIYSLGVVFYEMLTGEVPMGKFDPPSQRVQVDVRLDAVVLRTLEREPERRYQQVSEVKSGVATICESAPAPAKTTRRFPFKFTALCTLFFAAVWFAAGALWNWRGPGVIAGSVMLAVAIGLALFQARTHFPVIVENYRLDSRWRIFTRIVLVLGQSVVAYYLIVGATLQIAERVAWPFTYLDREEFETLYKGQEFKLLRELSAFAKDIPKAELVPERADWSAGLMLLGNQTLNRAFFSSFGILAQLAFGFVFFANIVNALVTTTLWRWRLDPRWRELLRPIVAITIALVGGWCMVQFRSVLIELTGGAAAFRGTAHGHRSGTARRAVRSHRGGAGIGRLLFRRLAAVDPGLGAGRGHARPRPHLQCVETLILRPLAMARGTARAGRAASVRAHSLERSSRRDARDHQRSLRRSGCGQGRARGADGAARQSGKTSGNKTICAACRGPRKMMMKVRHRRGPLWRQRARRG